MLKLVFIQLQIYIFQDILVGVGNLGFLGILKDFKRVKGFIKVFYFFGVMLGNFSDVVDLYFFN